MDALPIIDLTQLDGNLIFLRYFIGILFLIIWSLSMVGFSYLWNLAWKKEFSLNFEDLIYHSIFGLALQTLFFFILVYVEAYHTYFHASVVGVTSLLGARAIKVHPPKLRTPSPAIMFASFLFLIMVLANLIRQFGIPSGQEAFQYHFFMPRLYNEQLTLFLSGPIFMHQKNFWGFELMFILSDALGGWHLMQLQAFWYLVLSSALGISVLRMYKCSFLFSIIGGILILTTPYYLEYTWYVKPAPLIAGLTVYICSRLIHKKNFSGHSIIQLSLITWLCIQLKITTVFVLPILAILLIKSKFRFIHKLFAFGTVLILLLPWYHLRIHYIDNPPVPPWNKNPVFIENYEENIPPQTLSLGEHSPNKPSFIRTVLDFLDSFKPWHYLFVIALPLAIFNGFKLPLTIFYGFVFGVYFHEINPTPAFGDTFRYTGHFLMLIPITLGYTLHHLFSNRRLLILLIMIGLSLIVIRRVYTTFDAIKYYSTYMTGEKTFHQASKHLGSDLLTEYLDFRHEDDKLLYMGQANLVIRHPSIYPVGPPPSHLKWLRLDYERFLNFCHDNGIKYILYDHHKYSAYARGYGGQHYANSLYTYYYKKATDILSNKNFKVISGLNQPVRLISVPDKTSNLESKTRDIQPQKS